MKRKAQRSHINLKKLPDGTLQIPRDLEFKTKEYKYAIDDDGIEYRLHKSRNGLLTIIEKEDENGEWHWYIPKELEDRIKLLIDKYNKPK